MTCVLVSYFMDLDWVDKGVVAFANTPEPFKRNKNFLPCQQHQGIYHCQAIATRQPTRSGHRLIKPELADSALTTNPNWLISHEAHSRNPSRPAFI